jgi:DNA helicase-2/ATP-dependent DNA helicase PcrA
VFIVSLIDQRFPTIARSDAIPLPEGLDKKAGRRGGGEAETETDGDWHLEEERRLFYVAVTRAKEHVYFTSADDYGGARKRKLSRFLTELGFEKPAGRDASVPDPFLDPPADPDPANPHASDAVVLTLPKQFSFTQLSAFRSCPLQYKFAHILKIPVYGKWTFSFGKTMHNALHRFFTMWIERSGSRQASLFGFERARDEEPSAPPPVSYDELLALYAECWQDDWYKDDKQREEYRQRGRDQLRGFYEWLADHPARPSYLEQDFTLKIGGAVIKGRIDRIDSVDGGVEIIDYKTGTPKEAGKLEMSDKEQLLLYQMAARDLLGLNPVKLTYHYLENNSQVSFIGKPDDLVDLQEKILNRVNGIRASAFPATPGFHCKFCDFADICEYRQA